MKPSKVLTLISHVFLIAVVCIWIFPFVWTISGSLKTNDEFFAAGIDLIPNDLKWENYTRAWDVANISTTLTNSVIFTCSVVLIVTAMSALTGYALAKVRFPGRMVFMGVIVSIVFIPKGYTIIPIYLLVQWLGLLDKMTGMVLVESSGAHVLFILLFYAYFRKIPDSLEESAQMDGCGFLRTFVQIMVPLAKPVTASVAIVQFIWAWNSFFIPLIFSLGNKSLQTLAVGMYNFTDEVFTDYTALAAGSIISIIPVIIVFVFFQRYFVEGISGSVKE